MLLSASISLIYITSKPFPTKLCGSLHGAVAINQRATGLRQVLLLLSSLTLTLTVPAAAAQVGFEQD
jgi:hypothetical protein